MVGLLQDSNWNKGANWSILNGVATSNGAGLIQQSTSDLTPGKTYKISFEITEYTSGGVKLYSGSGSDASTYKNTVGTHTDTLVLNGNTTSLYSNNFIGSIDNVSVKEYLGQEVVPDSGCGSWLFEPQSTNLLTYSEQFDNASWINNGVTINANQVVSPDGSLTADLLTGVSGGFGVVRFSTWTSTNKVASCFAKKGSTDLFKIANASGGVGGVTFNLENGTITNEDSGFEGEIENYGNGWFRCTAIDTLARSGTLSLGVTAASESIYIWGAQLESGYKTSYIPTSGSTVTRLQDAAFGSGSSDLINSTEGVLYAEIAALSENYTGRRFITLNDATASNGAVLRYEASGVIVARYQISGIAQCSIAFAATITNYHKIAFKYSLNDFALWVDGVEVGVDSSGNVLSDSVLNNIDFNSGNGTFPFFGKTKCVAVFKEALTDAELTCLTTI